MRYAALYCDASVDDAGEGEGGDDPFAPMRADRDLRDAGAAVGVNHMRRAGRDAEMRRGQMIAKAKGEQIACLELRARDRKEMPPGRLQQRFGAR